MPLLTERVDKSLQGLLLLIGQRSSLLGLNTYVVGGLVRDIILNRVPPLKKIDIDLTVEGDSIFFAREIYKLFGGTLKVFPQFGTAKIVLNSGITLDFSSARQDFYPFPAAMPQVQPTNNLKEDLYRRDFTINTLAFSIIPDSYGKFFDFFGGLNDLNKKLIKVLYKLSFYDDPLRILRAIKFSQRLGFSYDDETRHLMQKAINLKLLEKVSREKLYRELELFFLEPEPSKNLKELINLKLLAFLFPRIKNLDKKERLWLKIEELGKKFAGLIDFDLINIFYLSFFYELKPEGISYYCDYIRLPKKRKSSLLTIIKNYPFILKNLTQVQALEDADIYELLSKIPGEGILFLMAISKHELLQKRVEHYLTNIRKRKRRLTGKDLIKMGMKPGVSLGKVLSLLQKDVLNGKVSSYQEEKLQAEKYIRYFDLL